MGKSSSDVEHQALDVARTAQDVGEVPVGCEIVFATSQGSECSHPFLPLEESTMTMTPVKNAVGTNQGSSSPLQLQQNEQQQQQPSPWRFKVSGKQVVVSIMVIMIAVLICDTMFASPENRLLKPDLAANFLIWVQAHPFKGAFGVMLLIAFAVVFMIPIGTPLALGCGYIYKSAYGWKLGLTIATTVTMGGSLLGAVMCFLLGRYLMRDQVRTWIREYPLFEAIDVAASQHGFRIMVMLYLTPVFPLGPVSYMFGTTSMALSSFATAKIASLPLKLLYSFIGASAGALGKTKDGPDGDEVKDIEENRTFVIAGILFSIVVFSFITHYITKELNKILDQQKKHKPGETVQFDEEEDEGNEEAALMMIEMGATQTAPRQRLFSKEVKTEADLMFEMGATLAAPRQRLFSSETKTHSHGSQGRLRVYSSDAKTLGGLSLF